MNVNKYPTSRLTEDFRINNSTTNALEVDVLIVGAGPAGSTAGLVLSRLGYRVLVIDRKPAGRIKLGECLPPRGLDCLRMLGLEQQFLEANHFDMQGYRVSWDANAVYHRDFLASPYGGGWLLKRERFDQMIIKASQQAGCRYLWQTRLHHINMVSDQLTTNNDWRIQCATHSKSIEIGAKAIIDATGRSRSVARRLTAKSRRLDRLVAAVCKVEHRHCEIPPPQDVLIESSENGWWYSANYSERFSILSYFTDADMPLPKNATELFACSQQLPQMQQRLKGARVPLQEKRVCSAADSSALDHCSGDRWLAVGDAACSFDPLSSYGMTSAIGSGYYGGVALGEELKGKQGHLAAYQSLMQGTFLDFIEARDNEYQKVRQFDSLFWQRRHSSR